MKKIRICYPFVGDSIGGSHLSSIELIKKLDKKKFEAIPLLHKKDILYPHLINEGLKPQFLKLDDFVGKKKGLLRNLIIIFKNILKITPYINKKNIDIIHLNDSSAGLSWILPTKISRAKLVWHQRIIFPKWALHNILFFFTENIICISDFVFNSLPKFNKKKSLKIFNPVTINKSKKNKLSNKYLKDKKIKKVLFLANIIESKRVDLFIKTAQAISKILTNSIFFIVGSDKKKILKKTLSKRINEKIIYVGFSRYKEFWLKNCDLLILTSENEGFNRTIVEGMLSKIPVVAVDSGAHKEIIKNNFNGWLVKRNNLRELTNISIKILNLKKKDLKKIIFSAEKFAKKNFNVRNHVNRISKIYFEAMF